MDLVGGTRGMSISGTDSRYSFLIAQVHRAPWLQQHCFWSCAPGSDAASDWNSAKPSISLHSSLLCGLAPHSHCTCEARALRRPLQCGHCETGRPFLLMCVSCRSWATVSKRPWQGSLSKMERGRARKLTRVLTGADSVASYTCIASEFLAVNQHGRPS